METSLRRVVVSLTASLAPYRAELLAFLRDNAFVNAQNEQSLEVRIRVPPVQYTAGSNSTADVFSVASTPVEVNLANKTANVTISLDCINLRGPCNLPMPLFGMLSHEFDKVHN